MTDGPSTASETSVPSHKLLQQVLWPALAGNVLWSFFQVGSSTFADAMEKCQLPPAQSWLKLIALIAVGAYLCADWLLTERMKIELQKKEYRLKYLVVETMLAMEIATFALLLTTNVTGRYATVLLCLVYVTAAVGLYLKAWPEVGFERRYLLRLNVAAAVLNAVLLALSAGARPWLIGYDFCSTLILCGVLGLWWWHMHQLSKRQSPTR